MWTKVKASRLGIKFFALVFGAFGRIHNYFMDSRGSSGGSNSSPRQGTTADVVQTAPIAAADSGIGLEDFSVLAELEGRSNVMQSRNSSCVTWEEQINPWNFVALPCEPEMALDIAQMAKLEAEMYRLKTGPGWRSEIRANPSYDSRKAVDHYYREAVSEESKDTDSSGDDYRLSTNEPYYFRNRNTGEIVGSSVSQPPVNQRNR